MQLAIYNVAPDARGWTVSESGRMLDLFATRFWALKGAGEMAYQRHAQTGQPAAVAVKYRDGQAVIAERFD